MDQQAYLVRLVGTRDLVGIFVADSDESLRLLVDECTEVHACEYAEMHDGGIMWETPAKPIPLPGSEKAFESGKSDIPWSGASLTWDWHDYFYGRSRWTPFDPEEAAKIEAELKIKPKKPRGRKKSAEITQLSSLKRKTNS